MPATAPQGYSAAQIALHWLTALLVVAAFVTKDGASAALRAGEAAAGLPLHVVFGIGVLILTLARLALRLTRGAPPPPASDPPAQRLAAVWGHRLLYLLLLLAPLGGMAVWFGGLRLPHGPMGMALIILAFGHALVALGHYYLRRDGLLRRMMRPG